MTFFALPGPARDTDLGILPRDLPRTFEGALRGRLLLVEVLLGAALSGVLHVTKVLPPAMPRK